MITKTIDQIDERYLQDLINNGVYENKYLEFKSQISIKSDNDKKEFLADVSSFANTAGGYIIYGISENNKSNECSENLYILDGLDVEDKDIDEIIRSIDSIIRDSIEPRIIGYEVRPIKLKNSKQLIIIHIPKSWISPHRVSYKNYNKFFSRRSNSKCELDVAELRIAFNLSEITGERVRKFREDRISKIYNDETPLTFATKNKIVLHLIPIISFTPAQVYDISDEGLFHRYLGPLHCGSWESRYNFDGFLTYRNKNKCNTYTQLFKNGIIEAVEGAILNGNDDKRIPHIAFENELIKSLGRFLEFLKLLNVDVPIFVFLSLLGVKDFSMPSSNPFDVSEKIDRDILNIPEILVESYNDITKVDTLLRPCFDSIWNACGFPCSPNYDRDGKWTDKNYRNSFF